jgi:hypothetical protein
MAEPTREQMAAAKALGDHLVVAANSRPLHQEILTLWRDQATELTAAADWPADHAVRGYAERASVLLAHSDKYYGVRGAPTLFSLEAGRPYSPGERPARPEV